MLNRGWANATWERKQQIIADHVYFELGTFYYRESFLVHSDALAFMSALYCVRAVANDPQVPPAVRTLYSSYGLCSDEFQKFGYLPPQLYVRISNRLVGDTVVTQNTIAAPRNKPDSIGVGDWSFDVSD